MEAAKNASKLFAYTSVDLKDELEEKYERAHQYVQTIINGLNDKELHDQLTTLVSKDHKQHEDISVGLLYIILTEPLAAQKTYRDLTLISRDGLLMVTNLVTHLVQEKFSKMQEIARRQYLWLLKELVKNQVPNVDGMMWNTLRQAVGGDVSPKNLGLVEGLLDIFIEHRPWLEKFPMIVGVVAYTFVRLIEDHNAPLLVALRNRETKFVISLIRDKFSDIMPLGREFVRLLQNVAKIPEFELLWKDILHNPKSLCPTFNGVWQLLQTRTSRRFLASRITPDIERKLHFLTNSVKFGNQKRYQDWFQDRYFTTPESHSLRSDIIRYIINAIHPTNDMLCSDIVPRWAIIGWLLTTCTNGVAVANVKLSIFYDWLFFDPVKDNIMNIEPGILVMYHSVRTHTFITTTLLDFLCRITKNFFPKYEERIKNGVHNSLRKIIEKQVIHNLYPLFESPKIDRDLRVLIKETFREFITSPNSISTISLTDEKPNQFSDDSRALNMSSYLPSVPSNNSSDMVIMRENSMRTPEPYSTNDNNDAKFSDDDEEDPKKFKNTDENMTDDEDDDLPLAKVRLKEKPVPDKVDMPASVRDSFEKFILSKSSGDLDVFLNDFRVGVSLDQDQEQYCYGSIVNICKTTLPEKCLFPESKSDEKLSESIQYPVFCLFKVLYQYEEKCKKCVLDLLEYVNARLPCLGYFLLYFLKVFAKMQSRKNQNASLVFKINVYKMLCTSSDEKVDQRLPKDLDQLEKYSSQMFLYILTDVYREFKANMVNNSEVLRIVVSCIDAKNLRDLIYQVTQGKLTIFKNDGVIDVIRDSLQYETFEQFCVWQLVQAHDVPIDFLQDILPEMESTNHEAHTYMLLLLKNEKPTTELVRLLLSRETKSRGDAFVTSAIKYWCHESESELSELIATLLTSKYPINSPNKRKRPLKNSTQQNGTPSSEQLLSHLEHFRRSCRHNSVGTGLFVQEKMQTALQQAFSHSTDSQKKQFSDLFALAAEDEATGTVSRRGTSSRGRKAPTKKETSVNNSASKKSTDNTSNKYSSGESSDEDWSKQSKTAKRKKKALSDSD